MNSNLPQSHVGSNGAETHIAVAPPATPQEMVEDYYKLPRDETAPNSVHPRLCNWYIPGFPADDQWAAFFPHTHFGYLAVRTWSMEVLAFEEVTLEFMVQGFSKKHPELYANHLKAYDQILQILGAANAGMKSAMAARPLEYRLPNYQQINWSGDSMVM